MHVCIYVCACRRRRRSSLLLLLLLNGCVFSHQIVRFVVLRPHHFYSNSVCVSLSPSLFIPYIFRMFLIILVFLLFLLLLVYMFSLFYFVFYMGNFCLRSIFLSSFFFGLRFAFVATPRYCACVACWCVCLYSIFDSCFVHPVLVGLFESFISLFVSSECVHVRRQWRRRRRWRKIMCVQCNMYNIHSFEIGSRSRSFDITLDLSLFFARADLRHLHSYGWQSVLCCSVASATLPFLFLLSRSFLSSVLLLLLPLLFSSSSFVFNDGLKATDTSTVWI